MTEMIDMSRFTEARSDQLNADDLIGISKTITVTRVTGNDGDQPVSIFYQGDNGKPFKPCKTIRRVLQAIWGRYANEYIGKSMTLYRDDKVTFGGLETGGIRISHMSDLDKETMVVVMKSKGKKVGIKIQPLVQEKSAPKADKAADGVRTLIARIGSADASNLANVIEDPVVVKQRAWLATNRPELAAEVDAAIATKSGVDDDPFSGPDDTQRGETNTATATEDERADTLIGFIGKKARQTDLDALMKDWRDERDGWSDETNDRVNQAFYARVEAIRPAESA
jgi:hypothetical protein